MEKTDGHEAKKDKRTGVDCPDGGIIRILKSHSESASLLRVISNAGAFKEVEPSKGDTGLFCNLEAMLSVFIHNGKNHLGPIKGYASLIQDDNEEGNNTRWWADKIVRGVEKMEKYFEALSMFRIKGALDVGPVSWHELTSWVVQHYSSYNGKGLPIEVTNSTHGAIRQRGELLKRVLAHLLTNAYESVRHEGKVSLAISDSLETVGLSQLKKAVVKISDTGCGIEEKNADLIWKPFFSTKHDHIGLGLPFVLTAAPLLDMEVELRSQTGKGTTVTLVLTEQGG